MGLQEDINKVVENLKKVRVIKPETQAEIDAVKESKKSLAINKRI
ncbi:hypothetical protein ES708_15464 [subsurface metagenome]